MASSSSSSSNIPSTMDAIVVSQYGGPEVLQHTTDHPVPELKHGQVLVRNTHIGVNYLDVVFRSGTYQAPQPYVPGVEAAGVIVAAHPSVTTLKPGTPVVYMALFGVYAAYTAVDTGKLLPIPAGLKPEVAAAGLFQGVTALAYTTDLVAIKAGQWALVHSAAGGLGLLFCQILSRVIGAKVIGLASSDEKCKFAKEYGGAEWVINSRDSDIPAKVNEITGGHGVDAIFDGVGKETIDADVEMVARKGTIVVLGNASGVVPPFDIARLGSKLIKLVRPNVTSYFENREEFVKYSNELFDLILSGKVNVRIHKTYALKDASQLHSDLESRKTMGKLIFALD